MPATKKNNVKCYNSFSCILSVLVIVFVLGSILWDMCITKPAMRSSIEDIKIEVQEIRQKLDANYNTIPDSTFIVTDNTK